MEASSAFRSPWHHGCRRDSPDPERLELRQRNSSIVEQKVPTPDVDVPHRSACPLEAPAGPRVHQQVGLEPATEEIGRQRGGNGPDSVTAVNGILAGEADGDLKIPLRGIPLAPGHGTAIPDGRKIGIKRLLQLEPEPFDEPHPFRPHGEVNRDSINGFG